LVSVSAPVPQRLLDSLDESPVVAYVKDLDGRYLRVNPRYQEFFELSAEGICGRTDDQLTPRQTVDGPRIASGTVSEDEPLQLEYTVAPFEGRPALAVWRFAVRAESGDTVAVCGVAAPVADAALARRECERLMAAVHDAEPGVVEQPVERRAEAETGAAGDDLRRRLEAAEAGTLAERARAEQADTAAQRERERLDATTAALHAERARADQMAAELGTVRGELASVRGRLERAEAEAQAALLRAEKAEAEAQAAHAELASEREHRTRTEEEVVGDLRRRLEEANAEGRALIESLRHQLASAEAAAQRNRQRADAAEAALNAGRADAEIRVGVAERRIAELEGSLSEARARELDADTEHAPTGPTWDSSAQRAFTTALSQSSDWRVSVKSAIGVVGSEGGWDAVCAWQPEDLNGFASCFAMWTGENHRLAALETATWQRRQPLTGSTIGEALTSEESRWLTADPGAADRRLQLLAQHGIRGALIVPVKDGARPVAALELLTVGATEPSRDLVDAIETMALQLGHFSHLLSAGAQARWRFGRA
jgi:PAS domain-containing protein